VEPDNQENAQAWVALVEEDARNLCTTVKDATEAGVPDALLLPALIAVFREAGMLPDLDFSGLLGMLG
jgi:hypothetical protein